MPFGTRDKPQRAHNTNVQIVQTVHYAAQSVFIIDIERLVQGYINIFS